MAPMASGTPRSRPPGWSALNEPAAVADLVSWAPLPERLVLALAERFPTQLWLNASIENTQATYAALSDALTGVVNPWGRAVSEMAGVFAPEPAKLFSCVGADPMWLSRGIARRGVLGTDTRLASQLGEFVTACAPTADDRMVATLAVSELVPDRHRRRWLAYAGFETRVGFVLCERHTGATVEDQVNACWPVDVTPAPLVRVESYMAGRVLAEHSPEVADRVLDRVLDTAGPLEAAAFCAAGGCRYPTVSHVRAATMLDKHRATRVAPLSHVENPAGVEVMLAYAGSVRGVCPEPLVGAVRRWLEERPDVELLVSAAEQYRHKFMVLGSSEYRCWDPSTTLPPFGPLFGVWYHPDALTIQPLPYVHPDKTLADFAARFTQLPSVWDVAIEVCDAGITYAELFDLLEVSLDQV